MGSKTFASLAVRNYRLWFFGNLVVNIGSWMQIIAQDWLVLRILTDGSGLEVGIVTALQFGPQLLLGPYAGVLTDRYDRRKIMYGTMVAMALCGAGLGALVVSGLIQLWMVYGFALLLGSIQAIDSPPRTIFVSELVEQRLLPNAVSLNSASFNGARMVGPAISGLLISAVGTGWVFIIAAVSFLAPLTALYLINPAELYIQTTVKAAKGQIREGLRYVRTRTDIVVILIVAGLVSAFGLNYQLTIGVMATNIFHLDAAHFGLLSAAMACGSLLGALYSARAGNPRVRTVVFSALLFGVASLATAWAPGVWTFGAALVFVGYFALRMIISANATIQLACAPEVRGRVMSLYVLVFLGVTPVGSPTVGWIADNFSPRWAITVGAVVSIIAALWAMWWTWRHWNIEVHYGAHRPHITGPRERAQAQSAPKEEGEEGDQRPELG